MFTHKVIIDAVTQGGQGAHLDPGMPGAPGRPAGGSADIGDRRVHGVLPEVVGLPRGDLIKQVRLGPAVDARCRQYCVLELRVPPPAEGRLGQEPLAQSLQGQRLGPAGPAPLQRVRGEAKELLAGERVIARVQGRKPAQHLEDVSVAGEPVKQGVTGSHGVLGSRPLPGGHTATVDHNRQPQEALAAAVGIATMQTGETAPLSRWVVTFRAAPRAGTAAMRGL